MLKNRKLKRLNRNKKKRRRMLAVQEQLLNHQIQLQKKMNRRNISQKQVIKTQMKKE